MHLEYENEQVKKKNFNIIIHRRLNLKTKSSIIGKIQIKRKKSCEKQAKITTLTRPENCYSNRGISPLNIKGENEY